MKLYVSTWIYITEKYENMGFIEVYEGIQRYEKAVYPTITYFIPDKKKSGGKYVTKKGYIKKIREYESDVVFDDGTEILIDDIFYVENDLFNDIE